METSSHYLTINVHEYLHILSKLTKLVLVLFNYKENAVFIYFTAWEENFNKKETILQASCMGNCNAQVQHGWIAVCHVFAIIRF